MRKIYMLLVFGFSVLFAKAQDLLLLQKSGYLPATKTYPSKFLDKKINVSLPGVRALAMTDGPSFSQMTDVNSSGQRYFSFQGTENSTTNSSNLLGSIDISTLDVGVKLGQAAVLAGHSFRRYANIRYPHSLLLLATQGNEPYIGQQLPVGPKFDIQAYNEFYVGGQFQWDRLSLGLKAKLLYGTASMVTSSSDVFLTTQPSHYGLEIESDYVLRSSGMLRYYSLDSITFTQPAFTFDNLFYNNAGWGLDFGIGYRISDQLELTASVLDIGAINWDFYPREYKSQGTFTFEGLDLAEYIGDTTGIQVEDTLLRVISVSSGQAKYSTTLPARYLVAASFHHGKWMMNGQWSMRSVSGDWLHEITLGALANLGPVQAGIQCLAGKNQNSSRPGIYTSVGGMVSVRSGPVYFYILSDGLPGLFSPISTTRANLNAGCSIQF